MRLEGVTVVYSDETVFWKVQKVTALNGVSLHVGRGEKVAIIGANGAGKSTLVRVMSGVLRPNAGVVDDEGMSSALLSLNAGFDNELSGTRNVVMHGMLMGLTRKEAAARIDAVTDMSGLGDAMNRRVSTYSSGMRARLCFSTAINLDPDILLLDEAIVVGDREFRDKSQRIMQERFTGDRAIVMVSHSLASVEQLCERAVWLDHGEIMAQGETRNVVRAYREAENGKNRPA